MSSAVFLAILSLVFSGLNDVVFKRYNSRERSRGMIIFGIGVVWSCLLILDVTIRGDNLVFTQGDWSYALIAGVCVAVANILLLESLRHMEVSLGSTIYRLNTIVVVILSVLFLHETMSIMKLSGVVLGVIAVLLLYQHQVTRGNTHTIKLGLVLVVVAAILRAVYGVVTKAGLSAGANADALILVSSVCWILSGLLYAVFIERRVRITRQKVAYSLVSGLLVFGVVKTLVAALDLGEASVVVTIANMSFLVALLTAIVLKMETVSGKKIAAMLLAISAITLLSRA